MAIQGINLTLRIGKVLPTPVPQSLAEAVQSVEVTQSDDGSSGFQISFRAERTSAFSMDYPLITSPLLKPFNRVIISVSLGASEQVLMDGFITNQQLMPGSNGEGATITVTGEDVSVMMDMVQLSLQYPAMGDSAIALLVLEKYSVLGVLPVVIPTLTDLVSDPLEQTPQQNGMTDKAYLKQLASNYGYLFYVTTGAAAIAAAGAVAGAAVSAVGSAAAGAGVNIAYWGPPVLIGVPQKALNVDMGPFSNVESVNFVYDALSATLVHGMILADDDDEIYPVATFSRLRPPLSTQAVDVLTPVLRNNQFPNDPNNPKNQFTDWATAMTQAQAITDTSSDSVVQVTGELDVMRYGSLLNAPGLVDLRGAGQSYDGTYYVKTVKHDISIGKYRQNFTLTRSGVGSLITEVAR